MACMLVERTGVYVGEAGLEGLAVSQAGTDGVYVRTAGSPSTFTPSNLKNGIEVAGAEDNGLHVGQADENGVYVGLAVNDGVHVNLAVNDGVYVGSAGSPSTTTPSNSKNGIEVAGAEDDGLYVGRADRNGVYIDRTGQRGFSVVTAGTDGVYVGSAGADGVYVGSADNYGINVTGDQGAGIFRGDVEVTGGSLEVRTAGTTQPIIRFGDEFGYGDLIAGSSIVGIKRMNGGAAPDIYIDQATGNVTVPGNLSKGGGSFKIDHPLDPENKVLLHSFVESPDMMNVYNGNVTTDAKGRATVVLPEWFEALNRDFRYQLTVISVFAQAIVAEEIKDNRFVIMTDQPHVEVSWQVTGIRQDPWANTNRIPVEVEKPEDKRGRYLHPEAYGLPPDRGLRYGPELSDNN